MKRAGRPKEESVEGAPRAEQMRAWIADPVGEAGMGKTKRWSPIDLVLRQACDPDAEIAQHRIPLRTDKRLELVDDLCIMPGETHTTYLDYLAVATPSLVRPACGLKIDDDVGTTRRKATKC